MIDRDGALELARAVEPVVLPASSATRPSFFRSAGKRTLCTSVLLPEPLTPATTTKRPSGTLEPHVFQIVLARAGEHELGVALRDRRGLAGGAAVSRARCPVGELGFASTSAGAPAATMRAAVRAAARPEIDEEIAGADRLDVVLDDQHRGTEIDQAPQVSEQAPGVARVKADGRLVEHVERAREPGAELRGQAQALDLAARKRARRAIEREVAEPDLVEKAQPLRELARAGLRRAAAASPSKRHAVMRSSVLATERCVSSW